MSTGGPDLFVVCKNCRAEVSPYITECPYCGSRLRKRAPKIDREGKVSDRKRRRPPVAPSLPRLRPNEIPGIRSEGRPVGTWLLVLLGLVGCLLWRTGAVQIGPSTPLSTAPQVGVVGPIGSHWWLLITATFTYANTGYAFVCLSAIALFGWLLERRHGALAVIALSALGGVGGTLAATAIYAEPAVLGANGAALAMIVAWALPDVLEFRQGRSIEGDLLGASVFATVVALTPLAQVGATWPADLIGVLAGLALGVPLLLSAQRR